MRVADNLPCGVADIANVAITVNGYDHSTASVRAVSVRNGGLELAGRNKFAKNKANSGNGGAIRVHTESPWSIPNISFKQRVILQTSLYGKLECGDRNTTLKENEATVFGGGISVELPDMLIVKPKGFHVELNQIFPDENECKKKTSGVAPCGVYADNRYRRGGMFSWSVSNSSFVRHDKGFALFLRQPKLLDYTLKKIRFLDNHGSCFIENAKAIGMSVVDISGCNFIAGKKGKWGVIAERGSGLIVIRTSNFIGFPPGDRLGNAMVVKNSIRGKIDARKNYWGHRTGPYHPTLNPTGRGGSVSDGVNFKNYRKEKW